MPRLARAWCLVGHSINPYANGGRAWAYDHRWADGHCRDCHKTVKQILVPVAEKVHQTEVMEARGLFNFPWDNGEARRRHDGQYGADEEIA